MKRIPLFLICILSLINSGAKAEKTSLPLSGVWKSSLGECMLPGSTDENHLGDGIHRTDITTELTRLWPFEGVVDYERIINLPESMAGDSLELRLERTKPSTLWVDGDSIGHRGHLYAPHVYHIGPLTAGKHTLRIRIDNSAMSVPAAIQGSHAWTNATQTNWNGILGEMTLSVLPATRITGLQVYPKKTAAQTQEFQNTSESRQVYAAVLKVKIHSDKEQEVALLIEGDGIMTKKVFLKLDAGSNNVSAKIAFDGEPVLWSEFHPHLYTLKASLLKGEKVQAGESKEVTFGLREFGTKDKCFTINGYKTFMRGTHDGCVFPLTGYCPTDTATWMRVFRIARAYGLNHFRFHSYTPTEAAFVAADRLGFYLQVELPIWGKVTPETKELNTFLLREANDILEQFGNHPSLMAVGIGNELNGDHGMMRTWLDRWREKDPRHLYVFGSNNTLGWKGVHPGEDYMVTCRIGGNKKWEDDPYKYHTRSSFSFADADEGGLLNNTHPNTQRHFGAAVGRCEVPVISHESCQFQVYPDYTELPKYTGVLYPYSLEIFRDRLKENHLTDQIEAFHQANGRFAAACDKADIEYCLRTYAEGGGFGGYQILDLKDYTGQGSALCGILDAHMDSKGIISEKEWGEFVAPVVPLALMEKHCWLRSEMFRAVIDVCNFLETDMREDLICTLQGGDYRYEKKYSTVTIPQGGAKTGYTFECPLKYVIKRPSKLTFTVQYGAYTNHYDVWVYPDPDAPDANAAKKDTKASGSQLVVTKDLKEALTQLKKGRTVLFQAPDTLIAKHSVGGLFTPDYWNYAMFKTISENNHKPVSPGTMGLLMDPEHPLFRNFPTEGRSNWQWWPVARFSRPLILDAISEGYRPLVQAIDNVERNHLLGILMEFNVGKGKLLLTTTDLDQIAQWPEGKAYTEALKLYAKSGQFQPEYEITTDDLISLMTDAVEERSIKGVKNISDYKQ